MANRSDNMLEKGYWEDVKVDEKHGDSSNLADKYWQPKKFCDDYVLPYFVKDKPAKPMGRTAYLDGLRGFAALMVYFGHHQLWAHDSLIVGPILENGFGWEKNYHFCTFPGIRLFFTGGHFAVTVFFVISGYVLSAKPLSLIHNGDMEKLGENLGSALFRRWLRLYIPVIATTLLYAMSFHIFRYRGTPEPQGSFRDEMWKWYTEFKNFSFVFRGGGEPWFHYNFHTWSIPVEMRGSIVVYTSLLALAKCRRNARLLLQMGLIFYFMYIADGWFCCLFLAGMLLCDLDLLAAKDNLPRILVALKPYKDILYYTMFFVSLFLGGVPSHTLNTDDLKKNPGWFWLSYLKPQAMFDYKWFYLFWASTFLVSCIPRISWLRSFFETRFCQYLGRVSFALYLVHGPILWSIGDRIYAAVGWPLMEHQSRPAAWIRLFPLPAWGPLGLEMRLIIPQLLLLPLTLWVAEIVARIFDEPSVKFAQWLYRTTKEQSPPTPPKGKGLGITA
jgi:peptidoglycan/LPS O-acetylase OafA/YrhL